MKPLVELLAKHGLSLASCESLTGGLFATAFTEIAGAGQVFKGGFVVYSNEAKIKLVKVSQKTLQKQGAISAQCAKEMAYNAQKLLGTDLAISFTGNAGPTAQENKPLGLVYIALVIKDILVSKEYHFFGSREEICQQAVKAGIRLIKDKLNKK